MHTSCLLPKGFLDREVDHPSHYTTHPSGVECIEIAEHMSFNLGNAIKYTWRAGLKTPDAIKDLKKAAWYVNREIQRLEKLHGQVHQPEKPGTAP